MITKIVNCLQDRHREAEHDTHARDHHIMSLVDSLVMLIANIRLNPFEKIEKARVIVSLMISTDGNEVRKRSVPITTYVIKMGQFCYLVSNLMNKALSMISLRRVRLGLIYTLERAHGNVNFICDALEILLSSIFFDKYQISLLDEKSRSLE